jgi:hypothetical protein
VWYDGMAMRVEQERKLERWKTQNGERSVIRKGLPRVY